MKKISFSSILMVLCLLFILPPLDTHATDTLQITQNFKTADIKDFGYLYIEKKQELDFVKIKNLPDSAFTPIKTTGTFFPYAKQVYWVKYHIKNNTSETTDLLLVGRNMTVDRLQVFTENEDKSYSKSILTGDFYKFSVRELMHRYYLFDVNIPPGETKTVYIYSDKYRNNQWLRFRIEDRESFLQEDRIITFHETIYLGFLMAICCFSLIFSVFNRRRIFILFFLYCANNTIWIMFGLGYGFKYLWSDFQELNNLLPPLCGVLHCLIMLAIVREYLNLKLLLAKADTFLRYLVYIFIIFLLYGLLSLVLPDYLDTFILQVGSIVQLIYCFSIPIITWKVYQKTHLKEQLIFLAAFILTIVVMACLAILNNGLLSDDFSNQYILYWLFGVDMLTLIILLSQQVRKAFQEKYKLKTALEKEKLKAASALIEGQQNERQRISYDLHDGLSLQLALIKMKLSVVSQEILDPNQKAKIDTLITQMSDVSSDLRTLTHDLSPLKLEEQSLEDAIEDLVYRIEKNQSELDMSFYQQAEIETKLSNLQCHIIYQVIQELLNNILKYSKAKKGKISLHSEQNLIILSVKDNGIGFDVNSSKDGIGLKNIKLRADYLLGEFKMEADENGSRFIFSFPI